MVDKVLFSSEKGEWGTPQDLFDELDAEYKFNLDPAASEGNAKCRDFYTVEQDGLSKPWHVLRAWREHRSDFNIFGAKVTPGRVFCNPPYGRKIGDWLRKAEAEFLSGNAELIVMLLPARTCTAWFHDYVYNKAEVIFLRGRITFEGAPSGAPFPSMLAIWGE